MQSLVSPQTIEANKNPINWPGEVTLFKNNFKNVGFRQPEFSFTVHIAFFGFRPSVNRHPLEFYEIRIYKATQTKKKNHIDDVLMSQE